MYYLWSRVRLRLTRSGRGFLRHSHVSKSVYFERSHFILSTSSSLSYLVRLYETDSLLFAIVVSIFLIFLLHKEGCGKDILWNLQVMF